jgi:hypothetical protein
MIVGRLPASNLTEANDMVAKVIAYDQESAGCFLESERASDRR